MTESAMDPPVARTSRRRRSAAVAGQLAGVVGIAVSVLLIVVVLLGRAWIGGVVEDVRTGIDGAIARTAPVLEGAQATVAGVAERMDDLAAAAQAIAEDPGPAPAALAAIQERIAALSERYLALRAAYADVRSDVVAAVDRLTLLARIAPWVEIPAGPVEALATFDERIRELDARVMAVFEAGSAARGAADRTAAAVAGAARQVQGALDGVTAALETVETRLAALREQVAGVASSIGSVLTLGSLLIVVLLVYLAFLHVVLFRASRRFGAAPAA
jgi:hypothetical protein